MLEQITLYLTSRTVWAAIIAFAATVSGFFGVRIVEADQVAIVDAITSITASVASIAAVYFRVNPKANLSDKV